MKAPKKLYLVISRKLKDDADENDICFSRKEANNIAKERNEAKQDSVDDWRVETYVKGD